MIDEEEAGMTRETTTYKPRLIRDKGFYKMLVTLALPVTVLFNPNAGYSHAGGAGGCGYVGVFAGEPAVFYF